MTYTHAYEAFEVIGQVVSISVALLSYSLKMGNMCTLGFYVSNVFMAYCLAWQRAKLHRALRDPQPETHCAMDFLVY
eukprot:6885177-Pyramimonas_sp.AAC.1